MGKTLKDVLGLVNNVINSNDFSAALSASNPLEVEFEDEVFDKIKNQTSGLMTFESAVNNDRVVKALSERVDDEKSQQMRKELHKSIYGNVEQKINDQLGAHFNVDLSGKKLSEQIDTIKTIKLNGDESTYRQEIDSLHKKLKSRDEEVETFKQESQKKFDNYRVDTTLDNYLHNYKLAEPYQDDVVKQGIFNTVKSQLKEKATLKLGEGNTINLFQKENPELEYFENNKKASVKDLIDPMMHKYIVKSNGKPKGDEGTPTPKIEVDGRNSRDLMKKSTQFV